MFSFLKEWKNATIQTRRICKKLHAKHSLGSYYLIWQILNDLKLPNHKNIQKNANKLIIAGDNSGYFYLAESYLLQNDSVLSKKYISKFLEKYPHHPDASYLLVQIEILQGHKQQAKERLQKLLGYSQRKKTWQVLSNLVDTSMEFDEYEKIFRQYHPHYENKKLPYDLICYLSNAAWRGTRDDFALKLWKEQWSFRGEKQEGDVIPKFSRRYTDKSATIALSAIKQCLDKAEIPFFLISGTLLGCIRESKLLRHDKDIDIGVWDTHTIQKLTDAVKESGCFYVLPNYSQDILVIRHTNGTTIDIFVHHREANDYWHAGGKCSWHNSPFELIYHKFLGDYYLIPKDYDLYLTENYGSDWHIPKIDFDSTLDTPNMKIIDNVAMQIYLYKKLFCIKDHSINKERIISLLSNIQ